MVINHNISALNTFNKLTANTKATQSSLEKLSSGLRINKAADDAAGLAISEKMKAQINGLNQAQANAQNGISMIQTAEGSLSESQSILQRMNDLAVQAKNGTNSSTDASQLQAEADQLAKDLDRISTDTSFNGLNVIAASAAGSLFGSAGISLQIGAKDSSQSITIAFDTTAAATTAVTAAALGVGTGAGSSATAISLTASTTISTITKAIDDVSSLRAQLGAYQNRLDHTINNLSVESENLTSAESAITDVNMAQEMTNFTKNNILVQSATAMLAQANSLPQGVLSLLK